MHKELHESKTGCGNAIPYDKIQILQISTAKPWEKINASVARSAMLDDDERTLLFTAGTNYQIIFVVVDCRNLEN